MRCEVVFQKVFTEKAFHRIIIPFFSEAHIIFSAVHQFIIGWTYTALQNKILYIAILRKHWARIEIFVIGFCLELNF